MIDASAQLEYRLDKGVLRFRDRVVVGNQGPLHEQIVQLHDLSIGGHSRIRGTLKRVQQHFYCLNMRQSVKAWVAKCDMC